MNLGPGSGFIKPLLGVEAHFRVLECGLWRIMDLIVRSTSQMESDFASESENWEETPLSRLGMWALAHYGFHSQKHLSN